MKTLIIITFLLIPNLVMSQVVKIKIVNCEKTFYDFTTAFPDSIFGIDIHINKNHFNNFTFDTLSGYMTLNTEEISATSDDLLIWFFDANIKINIRNFKNIDTLLLPPIYNFDAYITIKDEWFKYDDFRFYKKQRKGFFKEYNNDSTYYRVGKYKGFKHRNDESGPFHFSENGIWKCYSIDGELISEYNYKRSTMNGKYHLFPGDSRIEIKGQFKDDYMDGKWEFIEPGKKAYSYYFKNNVIIYDCKKCNR